MKLSELKPGSFQVVSAAQEEEAPLKLSSLKEGDFKVVEMPGAETKEESVMDRLKDPDRWKAILFGTGPKAPDVVAGTPALALPVGGAAIAAPWAASAVDKVAKVMQASRGARVAANTAQGAIADDENRLRGAGVGLATGLIGEGVNKVVEGAKGISSRAARFSAPQAASYVENPKAVGEMAKMIDDPARMPKLQDSAVDAISEGRTKLKAKGLAAAKKLSELFEGKSLDIDVSGMDGISPEADAIIAKARAARGVDAVTAFKELSNPNTVFKFDANEANRLKRALQNVADYKPKPGTILDPAVEARSAKAASQAGRVKAGLERLDPEVSKLNSEMQQGMLHQQALRQGGKSRPLAFLSSEAPDSVAALARAEEAGAEGLVKFGNQYGAAKNMTAKDVDDALSRQVSKFAGRAGLRASAAVEGIGSATSALTGKRAAVAVKDAMKPRPQDSQVERQDVLTEKPIEQRKGEDRWAWKGLEKLGITDEAEAERLLQSKNTRWLLIEASDLPAGSKRLKEILKTIQGENANADVQSSTGNEAEVFRRERKPSSRR